LVGFVVAPGLDEVEAPLDEVVVVELSSMIRSPHSSSAFSPSSATLIESSRIFC